MMGLNNASCAVCMDDAEFLPDRLPRRHGMQGRTTWGLA